MDRCACKFGDGARPKVFCRNIRLHYAHFPHSRKSFPKVTRDVSSNSAPPIAAKNKEFGHIPDIRRVTDFRPFLHQDEPCQFAVYPDKKRMPAGLAPIERKVLVDKPPIGTDVRFEELTEIVSVQLKQIR